MKRRIPTRLALSIIVGLLVLTPSAGADVVKPLIALGPTAVLNGTAVVSGTVGLTAADAQLTINGQPVGVDANGWFAATVNLGGLSSLNLALSNSKGETMTTRIPLNTNIVGPGGIISPSVLADLERAGVTLVKPHDGFKIPDKLPLTVEGSVLDRGRLVELKVNGIDVLGVLGGNQAFSLQVPGTTKVITISATDQRGVSQETQVPVQHATTPAPAAPAAPGATPTGRTVEASQAVGLRIARVRYVLRGVKRTKRLRVIVTIKDRRGFLVRNAAVGVRSAKAGWIRRNPKAKRTTRLGQASFVLTARQRAFGKRLRLTIIAKTPQAKARKAASVRLPRRG